MIGRFKTTAFQSRQYLRSWLPAYGCSRNHHNSTIRLTLLLRWCSRTRTNIYTASGGAVLEWPASRLVVGSMGDGSPVGRRRNYMTCMALAALAVAAVATVRFSTSSDAAWATVAHGEGIEYSSALKGATEGDFIGSTATSQAIDRASQQRSQLQEPHSVAGHTVSNALSSWSRGARGSSGSVAPLCPECNCTAAAVDAATAAAADAQGTAAEAVSAASAASASAAAQTAAEVQKEDCSKAVSEAVTRSINSTSTATQESISTAVAAATAKLKRQLSTAKKVAVQPCTASACSFSLLLGSTVAEPSAAWSL